jgi:hypothetical protein
VGNVQLFANGVYHIGHGSAFVSRAPLDRVRVELLFVEFSHDSFHHLLVVEASGDGYLDVVLFEQIERFFGALGQLAVIVDFCFLDAQVRFVNLFGEAEVSLCILLFQQQLNVLSLGVSNVLHDVVFGNGHVVLFECLLQKHNRPRAVCIDDGARQIKNIEGKTCYSVHYIDG